MPGRKKNKKNSQSARKTLNANDKLLKERFPVSLCALSWETIESEARKKLFDIIKDLHISPNEIADGSTMFVENWQKRQGGSLGTTHQDCGGGWYHQGLAGNEPSLSE